MTDAEILAQAEKEVRREFFPNRSDKEWEYTKVSACGSAHISERAKVIRLTDERTWKTGTPDFDGSYLCIVREKQECGTIWEFHRVVECCINKWVEKNEVIAWMKLPEFSNPSKGVKP
jgi:hypothetical protein